MHRGESSEAGTTTDWLHLNDNIELLSLFEAQHSHTPGTIKAKNTKSKSEGIQTASERGGVLLTAQSDWAKQSQDPAVKSKRKVISIVVHSAIEESTENSAWEMQRHAGGTQRRKESAREKGAGFFQSAGQSLQLTGDFDKHVRRGLAGRI